MTHPDQALSSAPLGSSAAADVSMDELLEISNSTITTVIDTDVMFEGRLTIKGNKTVLISGAVKGEIVSDGAVIVNKGAEVVGSIKARTAQVAGTVRRAKQGDTLDIEGALVLAQGARVQCDAVYGDLKAERGVVIAGSLRPHSMDGLEEFGAGNSATVVPIAAASSHQ